MSDTGDTPTEIREAVEEDLDELVAQASEDERERLKVREAEGVDEPRPATDT
ncbi:MAG: hypothetical protein ABL966_06295 [Acidimicrobiales bacterium]